MAEKNQTNKTEKGKTKNKKIAPVQELFPKFGEFNSVEELNEAAAGQLEEGDMESLKALAEENGIQKEEVQDYIDGYTDTLAMPITAAMGRISREKEKIKTMEEQKKLPCMAILQMAEGLCVDEEFAKNVMKKGKRIEKIADIMHREQCFMGTDKELEKIIRTYYKDGEKKTKETIQEINKGYKEMWT